MSKVIVEIPASEVIEKVTVWRVATEDPKYLFAQTWQESCDGEPTGRSTDESGSRAESRARRRVRRVSR